MPLLPLAHTRFHRGRWLVFAALLAVAFGGVLGEQLVYGKKPKPAPPPPGIPVTVATVQTADFAVYLNGLGTVEPYETVTVNSRVDGEIVKVAFRQGQMVNQGDVLVEIDPRPYQAALDGAAAKKAQDQAMLKDAQINLVRYATLARQDFASRQQLDTQAANVNQLVAQVAGDQAAIDSAQTQLGYATIRSPITGKTGFRLVDPGNIVHAATTSGIVTIARLQPIAVVFTAPEQDIPEINVALAAGTVPVSALDSGGLTSLAQGTLALVNNQINQVSGTISMKASFANTDNALWPGLSIATRLLVRTLGQVVVVSDAAIQHGPDGLYVYVVGADGKAEMRPVKTGDDSGSASVVTAGLSAGESVVTEGQYRLEAGSLVQAAPAAPPAAAPAAPATAAPAASAVAAPAAPPATPAVAAPATPPAARAAPDVAQAKAP
jgi:multidrug efflux system membrane fusion protein